MGQGLWNGVVYGINFTQKDLSEWLKIANKHIKVAKNKPKYLGGTDILRDEFVCGLDWDMRVQMSYECKPAYLGLLVAADNGMDDYGAYPLPARTSFPLTELLDMIDKQCKKRLAKVKKDWKTYTKLAEKKLGIILPEPKLLWVSDWD